MRAHLEGWILITIVMEPICYQKLYMFDYYLNNCLVFYPPYKGSHNINCFRWLYGGPGATGEECENIWRDCFWIFGYNFYGTYGFWRIYSQEHGNWSPELGWCDPFITFNPLLFSPLNSHDMPWHAMACHGMPWDQKNNLGPESGILDQNLAFGPDFTKNCENMWE